ncbi:MAG: glycerate kinase [Saprospiraceae bacterium]|nr:glycerate kinase [Saprospiraceae bacterium]MCB9326744.1 glycerate kinase [Lewinellaceae bacterium]
MDQKPMANIRIIIACDSFKDGASSLEVCTAIASGVSHVSPNIITKIFPMADGGEGTASVLTYYTSGTMVAVETVDPLERHIWAEYGLSADGQTAFIDMASASGIQLLDPEERNPLNTSTYGTGLMIRDAIKRNVKKIILGIGGSATNDAGVGMAMALGYRFYDESGNSVKGTGSELSKITSYDWDQKLLDKIPEVEVLADVNNPLYGHYGAAFVYGKQKGATGRSIKLLNEGLQSIAGVVSRQTDQAFDQIPGAGAAGGMGFGAKAFLQATLVPGTATVIQASGLEKALHEADYVFTGEGSIDEQTKNGKLVSGICQLATRYNVPVIGLCGSLRASSEDLRQIGLQAAFSIVNEPLDLPTALLKTEFLLKKMSENVTRLIYSAHKRHS